MRACQFFDCPAMLMLCVTAMKWTEFLKTVYSQKPFLITSGIKLGVTLRLGVRSLFAPLLAKMLRFLLVIAAFVIAAQGTVPKPALYNAQNVIDFVNSLKTTWKVGT